MTLRPQRGSARSNRGNVFGLFLATAVLVLGIAAASASAFQTHLLLGETEVPNTQGSLNGVAVDNASGHTYVATPAGEAVYNFGSDGKLDPAQSRLSGVPNFAPWSIAVDNSTGVSGGTIWVGSIEKAAVFQYSSAGAATGLNITAASLPPDGTAQGGSLSPVANKGPLLPRGLAVDGMGNLYVADLGPSLAIDKFSPGGVFIAQFSIGPTLERVSGIAVDASGNIWLSSFVGLLKVEASGQCVEAGCAPTVAGASAAVAVDRSSGTVFTVIPKSGGSGEDPHIAEYDGEGHLLGTTGGEVLQDPVAVAVDESIGRIYVTDQQARSVVSFGPVITLPDATTEPATGVGSSSAVFHGQVGAAGGPEASCVFGYVDDEAFQTERFAHAQSVPCSPAGPFAGETSNSVSAVVEGLNGGTTYHYRLLATSTNGANPGKDIPFTTGGPTAGSQSVSAVSETGARLEATVNPNGVETSYFFELVSGAQFQQSGFNESTHIPIAPLAVGADSFAVSVAQDVAGLVPGATYVFRAVAQDANGAIGRGPALSFVTFPSPNPNLPDGRVYEQASPVQKNASDVWGEVNAVKASASGDAITFYSAAGLPGATGAQFYGIYQADRAPDGSAWATEALLPEAGTGYFARIMGWDEELSQSYSTAKRSAEPPALYARQRGGSLQSMAVGSGKVAIPEHFIAASSASGGVVYFENVPTGKKPGAYVWDRETESSTLAGVMNDGKAPTGGTFAGPYEWFSSAPNTSQGGATAEYYTQAAHALSTDGRRAFFTQAGTGQLYVRENPLQPQSAVDGEGRCTDATLACTIRISAPATGVPDPEQPAAFLGATPNGNEAYFLSAGKLTADATAVNGRSDLYRYDLESGQLTDLTVDNSSDPNGADVQGILGTVGNGSRLYFVANGVLAPGAELGNCSPSSRLGECNLYVLSGGQPAFIGRLAAGVTGVPEAVEAELSDERDWVPTALFDGAGEGIGSRENTSRSTSDGQVLLFRSSNKLTNYGNRGVPELYLSRVGSPLLCVSCVPTGAAPTGAAGLQNILARGLVAPGLPLGTLTRNLSSTGTRVIFDTPDALVASDTNGVNDVYEWEMAGTGSCQSAAQNGGCLYLLSSGKSPSPSYFADASENGNNAFFFTLQSLVKQDSDELYDVYDARVGGGIAAQNEAEPRVCGAEECPAPAAGASPSSSVGSTAPQASNPKPKKCKKGFKRTVKHGKEQCVKAKKQKKKHPKHKSHGKHHKGHKQASHKKGGNK